MKKTLYYPDYLQLDKLLNAQKLISEEKGSPAHDELFFIVIHQVYELWFKQLIAEIDSIITILNKTKKKENLALIVERLHRIAKIQHLLIQQIEVIETLNPASFLEFRELLASASGFQSYQFRLFEIKLGVLYPEGLEQASFFSHLNKRHQRLLMEAYDKPSLFSVMEQWLIKVFAKEKSFLPNYKKTVSKLLIQKQNALEKDNTITEKSRQEQLAQLKVTREHFEMVFDEEVYKKSDHHRLKYEALIGAIYLFLNREDVQLNLAYQVVEKLIEIDELLTQWRQNHALMAQRMIGGKSGTGGTTGYHYLQRTVEQNRVFKDFVNLATYLIPYSKSG